jgi:hypothetical protein
VASWWQDGGKLVVWNLFYEIFHSLGNFIIPTDELHDFSEGVQTTNRLLFSHVFPVHNMYMA